MFNYPFLTSKERDNESGLDYFGARYYSSATARFLSVDPIAGSSLHVVNPQRWNGYAYVCNNPLTCTDVKGYWMAGDHDKITHAAYTAARIRYNNEVNLQNQRTDTGGQPFYHLGALGGLNDQDNRPGAQPGHFLRTSGDSQTMAYNKAIGQFEATVTQAREELGNNDQTVGRGLHQVQDAYAHTTRNDEGEITHIQCYHCDGKDGTNRDHHHPDYQEGGRPTVEGQGAIDASAA